MFVSLGPQCLEACRRMEGNEGTLAELRYILSVWNNAHPEASRVKEELYRAIGNIEDEKTRQVAKTYTYQHFQRS